MVTRRTFAPTKRCPKDARVEFDGQQTVLIHNGDTYTLQQAEEFEWVEPVWGNAEQYAELVEARAELQRHHRDFERIREHVYEALEATPADDNEALINALAQIRQIVG